MDARAGRTAGRPRSERARTAVLHAVDDLLVERGYAAMTMKGIAERAGVGRQTVYRWWSTKAEILVEACVLDAHRQLAVPATDDPAVDLETFLDVLGRFLAEEHAGIAYRALLGEAQHDTEVAALLARHDVLGESARAVLTRLPGPVGTDDAAVAALVGPVVFWTLCGNDPARLPVADLARAHLIRS